MARTNEKPGSMPDMAQLLRRQFRLAENARFLCRMPAFSTSDETPSRLNDLLRQLERRERGARR